MENSYPIYRQGVLVFLDKSVDERDAARVCTAIKQGTEEYRAAMLKALDAIQSVETIKPNRESIRERPRRVGIFDLPGMAIEAANYGIKLRSSLTVCRGERSSKIWVHLACQRYNGKAAVDLPADRVKAFFQLARNIADGMLKSIKSQYVVDLKKAGHLFERESDPYFFRFKAFNSADKTTKELCHGLGLDLTLSDAISSVPYSNQLRSFFSIALEADEKDLDLSEVVSSLRSDERAVFGYRTPEHDAMYYVDITLGGADFCGFGFEPRRRSTKDLLSYQTSGDLVEEYASQV